MNESLSAAAKMRETFESDRREKTNRHGEHYQSGRDARIEGKARDTNPLRYVPGKSSPEHPDLWEAQWDLGWDEAEDIVTKLRTCDPIERLVEAALIEAHVAYTIGGDKECPHNLDFHLTSFKVAVEVKQMHSDRISDQMSRYSDVIAVQGREAALLFGRLLRSLTPWYAQREQSDES